MSETKKKSVAQERKVNCYPHPIQLQKLETYAKQTGQTKSGILCEALKVYLSDKVIISKG